MRRIAKSIGIAGLALFSPFVTVHAQSLRKGAAAQAAPIIPGGDENKSPIQPTPPASAAEATVSPSGQISSSSTASTTVVPPGQEVPEPAAATDSISAATEGKAIDLEHTYQDSDVVEGGLGDDFAIGISPLFQKDKDDAVVDAIMKAKDSEISNMVEQMQNRPGVSGYGADLMSTDSIWPFCAWDATTDESIYTPLLLDPNAVYQPQLLSFATHPNRVYKFKAKYPKAIYLSYQSYTLNGKPLTSLTDLKIKPAWGVNPFKDSNATCDTAGGYEIYVTRHGKEGWPNELKGLPDQVPGGSESSSSFLGNLAIIIMRIYVTKRPPAVWGNVEPPEISYSDDYGKSWRVLSPCGPVERHLFNRAMKHHGRTAFNLQEVTRYVPRIRRLTCDMLFKEQADVPNFFPSVNVKDDGTNGYVPFANFDSDYAYWCTDGQQLGPDFVMVITGTAPTVSTGLYDPPKKIPDIYSYDIRYWGFASGELNSPRPTYATVSGRMMEEFYGPSWNRKYKVVAARNRGIVQACGLDDPSAMFLPFSNPNITDPPAYPVIIAREQLARSVALGLPESQPDTIGYVVKHCKAQGRCMDPNYLKQQMGAKAPLLQVYKCDVKTGKATPFVYYPTALDQDERRKRAAAPKASGNV